MTYSLFGARAGVGAAWSQCWSRPYLVGAEVGYGTYDCRSHFKKWRLRNTEINVNFFTRVAGAGHF